MAISVALFGFIAYGCWQLDASWKATLLFLGIPIVWLTLAIGSYCHYRGLFNKAPDDDAG